MAGIIKEGDLVRHRASGELGVVVDVEKRCVKHSGLQHLAKAHGGNLGGECEYEKTGMITIDPGFGKDRLVVEAYVCELFAENFGNCDECPHV